MQDVDPPSFFWNRYRIGVRFSVKGETFTKLVVCSPLTLPERLVETKIPLIIENRLAKSRPFAFLF